MTKDVNIDAILRKFHEDYLKHRFQEFIADLQQNWSCNGDEWSDQYGFTILVGRNYQLFHKRQPLITVYSFEAAKLITRVILNDMVAHMNTVRPSDSTQPMIPERITESLKVG